MHALIPVAFLTACCLGQGVAAQAAELGMKGIAVYVITAPSNPTKLDGGATIVTLGQSGIIHDDDPSSPVDLSAHDCTGTIAVSDDGTASGAGTCMATDSDNDVWWLAWTSDGKTGGTWQAVAGTGKYEGLSGSGTTTFVARLPDRSAITYEGSLTLR